MKRSPWIIGVALWLGLGLGVATAAAPPETAAGEAKEEPEAPPPPRRFVSEHRLQAAGTDIAYTVTAEDIYLRDAEDEVTATFFTISYAAKGAARPADRPLTFVFNGGPGSSSIWLHFGLVGPKLIDIPSDASDPGGPPYRLRDNPWTLLRATDLVFVDPVGTGFSKAMGEKENAESTHLPAYAASAYYHGKLADEWADLDTLLAEVEAWAGSEYLAALFRGDTLDAAEKERVAARLARYTGLSQQYVLRSDLRIYALRFIKELLRDEGKSVGLLDGRYVQDELDDVAEYPDGDPFSAKTGPIYVATFQSYLRNDLGVDITARYIGSSNEANQSWKRPPSGGHAFAGYVDVTGELAQGTKDNEGLRVFSAGGYHDLTTSYFATEYMLQHSGIDPERLTIENYDGGHMMYLYQPSLEALSDDIVAFIEAGRR